MAFGATIWSRTSDGGTARESTELLRRAQVSLP